MAKAIKTTTASPVPPLHKRRWLRWSLGLGITLLILLTLLPVALRYGAIYVLEEQGLRQVEIADVDLNLFSGSAALHGVVVSGNGQGRARLTRLSLNLAMTALLSKRLELEQVELEGLTLDVRRSDSGDWLVAGILPPPPSPAPEAEPSTAEPWGIAVKRLRLANITTQLTMPELQSELRIDQLQLSRLASWQPQQAASYRAQLRIDKAPLSLAGEMRPFAAAPQFNGTLELAQLPLALAAQFARPAGVTKLQGELAVTTEFDARLDPAALTLNTHTEIKFSDLDVAQGQYAVQAKQLGWQGGINYLPATGERDLGVRANGAVVLQQFTVHDMQAGLALASFDQLNVDNLVLGEVQQLTIERIALKQLTLLQQEAQRLVDLAALTLTDVAFDGDRALALNDVTLDGLRAQVALTANGEIELVNQIVAQGEPQSDAPPTTPETAAPQAADTPPFQLQLARLHITEDSRIHFKDASVKPPFEAEIKPLSLIVTNIDTANKDQPIDVNLHGVINGHEEITLAASVRPFGAKLNMKADGKITALDLPPLSPYANQAMGYYLKRGRLNSTMSMTVEEDQLNAKIQAKLNKFNIEEGDPAKHKNFSEKLSMPLDAALNLLRDKEDNIELNVSIDGDINDPQFDASKVINKALANATKAAVTTYVKFMLQPWGAMLIAAEMLGESGSVGLEPLSFAAGATALTGEHQAYLDKIAELLQQRPEVSLNICGLASEQDRQALLAAQQPQPATERTDEQAPDESAAVVEISNEQLLALATQRAEQVKQQLMARGVTAERLFNCHPSMDKAHSNPPAVNLFL